MLHKLSVELEKKEYVKQVLTILNTLVPVVKVDINISKLLDGIYESKKI